MFTPVLALLCAGALGISHDRKAQSPTVEQLETNLAAKLAKLEQERPDYNTPEFAKWDERYFEAQWSYGHALYRLAEARKQPELHRRVITYFTDFIWKREDFLAAYQARLIMARAHHALNDWSKCYMNLRAARLTSEPKYRKIPAVVEIATRSHAAELQIRAKMGEKPERGLEGARLHLKMFPGRIEEPSFVALRIEVARVLFGTGKSNEAAKTLREVIKVHGATDLGEQALVLMVDHTADPVHIRALADQYYEKHFFTSAVDLYRRLPKRPVTMLRVGQCYRNLRRFNEAIFAFERACGGEGETKIEAALSLERLLAYVHRQFGDPGIRRKLDLHRDWMRKEIDFTRVGDAAVKPVADSLMSEGKFAEALEIYVQIKPEHPEYTDALHSIGYCHFKLKRYAESGAAFNAYLGRVKKPSRSSDAALDLACWSLLKLDRAEDVLTLTEKRVPQDEEFRQWRLAHRVDALARLGRLEEARKTLARMNEREGFRAKVRALERIALGYEAAIRKTGDKKLWGAYARAVVALSEKTQRPLRGEKLQAAADALSMEETPTAYAMAFDLYTQYLADRSTPDAAREEVEYRRAQAAIGCGKLKEARDIAADLVAAHPKKGSYGELQADIALARAEKMPRGSARNRLLENAMTTYGTLASALRRNGGEHYHRLLYKYVSVLATLDPEQAATFFIVREKAGHGDWDGGEWGIRPKMNALKDRVFKIVPPSRRSR